MILNDNKSAINDETNLYSNSNFKYSSVSNLKLSGNCQCSFSFFFYICYFCINLN